MRVTKSEGKIYIEDENSLRWQFELMSIRQLNLEFFGFKAIDETFMLKKCFFKLIWSKIKKKLI